MANVKDSDIGLWLHNKLGSSERWSSGSFSSQLNPQILRNVKDCFCSLPTHVKLKLLLSFFHIPRKNMDEWRMELEDIVQVAEGDNEKWVATLARIMKPYAAEATLNLNINEPIFVDFVNEMKMMMKETKDLNLNLLPMEYYYLNESVLETVIGPMEQEPKHFTLKKKPKSENLRVELLLKASELQKSNAERKIQPAIPLRTRGMPRKMTDTTPLKGIPSKFQLSNTATSYTSTSRNLSRISAGKKEGGTMLLDITEQPIVYPLLAKRRKKVKDLEESKTSSQTEMEPTSDTPEYAAGFSTPMRVPSPSIVHSQLLVASPSEAVPLNMSFNSTSGGYPSTSTVPLDLSFNSISGGHRTTSVVPLDLSFNSIDHTSTLMSPGQTSQFQASLNSLMKTQVQWQHQLVYSSEQNMTESDVILQVHTLPPLQIL